MNLKLRPVLRLKGETRVPGDKSITHRALLLSALADGASRITGYLDGRDCRATASCLRALGVRIKERGLGELIVWGGGLRGWQEACDVLDCGRSGTTMRLLAGILAGQPFDSVLGGTPQLCRRPMDRIVLPLRQMGARIRGRDRDRLPPLRVSAAKLRGIEYALPVASAQVKSCLLLAGLFAEGQTRVIEPAPSRDHTERMLRVRGAPVDSQGLSHAVVGRSAGLHAVDTRVPGDFSSAAYFLVGALLLPGSELLLRGVGINPTRTGLLDALQDMGANIAVFDEREEAGEPVGDLWVRAQELRGAEVGGALVPRMIDEFPILALAATQAQGITRVRDASELRVKESDRIATTVEGLRALGARIEAYPDGYEIEGPTHLRGARVDSQGDHRLALTLAIAGLLAQGETIIEGAECISDSFPGFETHLRILAEGALE